ncbi:MAG: sulfite exporter TauE/SafE family protein [Gammaproteobacteria bacterium]|nr:sulfite exporter TauE/SafE family protein [Gammaproteobacteria bacterium]
MELWQIILLMFVGIASGWLNVMAGGGSLLSVPTMIFMDIPAPVANGTNRIAIFAQNLTAIYAFFRKGHSDFKLGLTLSAMAAIGSIGGASVGVHLDGVWFDYLLASVMIAVMILMATGQDRVSSDASDSQQPKNLFWGHVLMIGAGFWGGMIQIGVGFILMPILFRVMGFNLVRVNMYKVLIAFSFTIVALIIFASKLELLWWAGLGLAIGNSIGGWYGAHHTITKGEAWIKRVLYVTLSAFVIKLLFF